MSLPRLLLIGANPFAQEAYRQALRGDFELIGAANDNEALERVKDTSPVHLVLVLVETPNLERFSLYYTLVRLNPWLKDQVLFVVGGLQLPQDRTVREAFGDRILFKPFDAATIRSRLIELLQTSSASSAH